MFSFFIAAPANVLQPSRHQGWGHGDGPRRQLQGPHARQEDDEREADGQEEQEEAERVRRQEHVCEYDSLYFPIMSLKLVQRLTFVLFSNYTMLVFIFIGKPQL